MTPYREYMQLGRNAERMTIILLLPVGYQQRVYCDKKIGVAIQVILP